MEKYEFELLPISFDHLKELIELEFHHRDPFDRIIISQAIAERVPIVSKDKNFDQYPVNIIWK